MNAVSKADAVRDAAAGATIHMVWSQQSEPPELDDETRAWLDEQDAAVGDVPPGDVEPTHKPSAPPRLGDLLESTLERVERRCRGEEKPIALPWPTLHDHFGGGVWPGVHFIVKGTGIGGTQFCVQAGLHAARANVPTHYVGFEMGDFDIGVRAIGLDAGVPWSSLWTGQAGEARITRARSSLARLRELPFFVELQRPMGFSIAEVVTSFERVRAHYPIEQPILGVIDFLQLVGGDAKDGDEIRRRIANASYALRDIAIRLNVAVFAISSIAREKLKTLSDIAAIARLEYDEDEHGCPINRRMLDADAIVGCGKESGEIEYSADSVSVLARVAGTYDGSGCDVIFATAKGRATGATWSPLRFSGFRYDECSDRGGRVVEAWRNASEKRDRERAERKEQRETKKGDKLDEDARLVVAYVLANPSCMVTEARANALNNNARRWAPAVARIGKALVQAKDGKYVRCTLNAADLKPEHRVQER